MASTTIAVIGAGFSGTLLALHLLRRCPPGVRIRLIERARRFGNGTAYATGNANHLLNVPAARMSAFHDRGGDFLEWLQQHPDARRGAACMPDTLSGSSFLPRRVYGAYVRSLLKQELRSDPRQRLELASGEVSAIDNRSAPLRIMLDREQVLTADYAVLAIGNFPPESMKTDDTSFYASSFYRADPWAPDALADLDRDAPLLLIGTGLTTVDMVISLLDQGHRGPIHALSRRGLLPREHLNATPQATSARVPPNVPVRMLPLLRFLREQVRAVEAAGGNWRAVIDELRPLTQDLWQTMQPEERRRFLRHLRPWWDVHRHRMAPDVAARIQAACRNGQFRHDAGRIRTYRIKGDSVVVTYRPKLGETVTDLRVARVINCAGPGADYDRIADPLVRRLLADGVVRPDALRLGLDVTQSCALLHRDGSISRRLFAVGPVTKGAFWEITAVPDIRRQCEQLAQHLASLARPVATDQDKRRTPVPSYAI